MAAGKTHEIINIGLAILLTIYLYFNNHNIESIAYLDAGILYFTFIENPDLDILKSRVTQLWGPAGIIWQPFRSAGHREILHNWVWGPIILIGFTYSIVTGINVYFPKEVAAGGVIAIWSHIITDKL